MTGPFPETVTPPAGLTRPRMKMGLPVWAWSVVLIGVLAPPFIMGKAGLLLSGVTIGFGLFVAYEAYEDPQFLQAWLSELALKKVYR